MIKRMDTKKTIDLLIEEIGEGIRGEGYFEENFANGNNMNKLVRERLKTDFSNADDLNKDLNLNILAMPSTDKQHEIHENTKFKNISKIEELTQKYDDKSN